MIKIKGLSQHSPKIISSSNQLFHELEKVRTARWALDDSENNTDVRCVASPIFNREGRVEAVMGLTGTESQVKITKS
jgi:IclR family KDG regulon transcriptional repressor